MRNFYLKKHDDIRIVILDKLTYAGNLGTIREELNDARTEFVKGDIGNHDLVENLFTRYDIDVVVHFAAESHVDRSIENPQIFLQTNVLGTQNLLDVAKKFWTTGKDEDGYPVYKAGKKFHHVSTDEVYGSLTRDFRQPQPLKLYGVAQKLGENRRPPQTFGEKMFDEKTPLDPRSPYSASKTASDMIVAAYGETYHFPYNITRCSNNYGPYHFPEKLIPLMIKNVLEGKKLPVYGKGENVRDWLYVEDHCKAIDLVIEKGRPGEVYNIGGFNEAQNIDIVRLVIAVIARLMKEQPQYRSYLKIPVEEINDNLIAFVADRLGHDARYAINPEKIVIDLGWYPETAFESGIEKTVEWYLQNQDWVNEVTSGDYLKYYERMYGGRG